MSKKQTTLRLIKDVFGEVVFRYWKGDEAPPADEVEVGDIWETESRDAAYKFEGGKAGWITLRKEG